MVIAGNSVQVPFDAAQVLDNLRSERYMAGTKSVPGNLLCSLYYVVRPMLGPSRTPLQRLYFRGWDKIPFPHWPVDHTVEDVFEQLLAASMRAKNIKREPFIWFWPAGARSCTIMTHDVETSTGRDFCVQLAGLDKSFGIPSSFQIVPEKRYAASSAFLESLRRNGAEINIQDLNHDGLLFSRQELFLRRAENINAHARRFGAQGFRSAVMYRNIDWFDALDFSYDMSIPNVAHLDPQRGGCCTVLPYFAGKLLELPVTTMQDYTLFRILGDYSLTLWKAQISLIRKKHGLISFIVHPDYIIEEAARHVYTELLQYLSELRAQGETWIALPGEVAAWWKLRSELSIVGQEGSWHIEGSGSDRARLAYAVLDDDAITYELSCTPSQSAQHVARS
jgi:hypothetical protein